ncbi:MAG: hypothetical protein IT261_09145 [Saprospiraceae bacterium]|nr:hypothetical protein [Saprospiraceae bacterium]
MRSNLVFFIALAINAFSLLIMAGNISTLYAPTRNFDGSLNGGTMGDGMTVYGKLMTWLLPAGLLLLISLAIWLRVKGKLLAANLLLTIPALPMLAAIVIWGGLALIFILFGK